MRFYLEKKSFLLSENDWINYDFLLLMSFGTEQGAFTAAPFLRLCASHSEAIPNVWLSTPMFSPIYPTVSENY